MTKALESALLLIAANGEFWTEGHRTVARKAAAEIERPWREKVRLIEEIIELRAENAKLRALCFPTFRKAAKATEVVDETQG